MARALGLLFGLIAYAIFFATFLYLIAFVGNLPGVPVTVDRGSDSAVGTAIIVNLLLIALFGVQHSVMARQGFKQAWTRIVPRQIERSAYVLASSAALIILFAFWRPITGNVWRIENEAGQIVAWVLFALGWLIVLLSTFLISHFELFGLKQVWLHWRQRDADPPAFRKPFFYRMVRHPLYSGFFLAFWATPVMSWGHLLLAIGMSAYMLIAIPHEERDMIGLFGEDYESYRRDVGMLAPRIRRRT